MFLFFIGGVGVDRELNVYGVKCISLDIKFESLLDKGLRVREREGLRVRRRGRLG